MLNFPKKVLNIIYKINERGFEAYLVGGCVRDKILGIDSFDIDINTNANMETLIDLFKEYEPQVFEHFGNIKFQMDEYTVEITRYRKERDYKNHRIPETLDFKASLKDDILRRDFSVNALVYHPIQGIGDLVGGLNDLRNKEIKTIGNPDLKFDEDYLRMLRAIRFASKLDFRIETNTFKYLTKNFHKLNRLHKAQVEEELYKFLESKRFSKWAIRYPWILSHIIDEIEDTVGLEQSNKYHIYDVYEHTIKVIENLDTLELKIIGLFHDLGKVDAEHRNEDGSNSFKHHAKFSYNIILRYFDVWDMNGLDKKKIGKLVLNHGLSIPMDYIEMKKLVAEHGMEFMRKLVKFKKADNLAKSKDAYYQVEKCTIYDAFLNQIQLEKPVLTLKELKIKGNELDIEEKYRGIVLKELLNLVIEEEIKNEKEVLYKEAMRIKDDLY